jgi:hypothetical protein
MCFEEGGVLREEKPRGELKFLVAKHHLRLIVKGNVASPTFVFT